MTMHTPRPGRFLRDLSTFYDSDGFRREDTHFMERYVATTLGVEAQAPPRPTTPNEAAQALQELERRLHRFFSRWESDGRFEVNAKHHARRNGTDPSDGPLDWHFDLECIELLFCGKGSLDSGKHTGASVVFCCTQSCQAKEITYRLAWEAGDAEPGTSDFVIQFPDTWFPQLGPNTQRFLTEFAHHPLPLEERLAQGPRWRAAAWGPLPVAGPLPHDHPWLNREPLKALHAATEALPKGALVHLVGPPGSGLSTALRALMGQAIEAGASCPLVLDFAVESGHPKQSAAHLDAVFQQQDGWSKEKWWMDAGWEALCQDPEDDTRPMAPHRKHAQALRARGRHSAIALEGLEALGDEGIALLLQRLKDLLWADGAPVGWCVVGWKEAVLAPDAWAAAAQQPCATIPLPPWDEATLSTWHQGLPVAHDDWLDWPSAVALLKEAEGRPKAFLQAWKGCLTQIRALLGTTGWGAPGP